MFFLIFAAIDVEPILPPSISDFDKSGILETIISFIQFLYQLFVDLVEAVINFYDALFEINSYLNSLILSAQDGNIAGMPILEAVGLYRYLATDVIFYLTYMLVLSGCLFTIYKLICLLIVAFKEFKSSVTAGGVTSSGLLGKVVQLFR